MKQMETNTIYKEDCVTGMLSLPSKIADICVTSPPYNLDIKYNMYNDKKTEQEYLKWIEEVCLGIKHVLKDDGHFWLNVGYSNINPWVGMDIAQIVRKHFTLQNNFIWVKSISIDNTTHGHFKPINSDRFSNPTWEHLFHFTKNGNEKCDKLSIGVPYMYNCNIDKTSRTKGRLVKKLGYKNQIDFNKRATQEDILYLENELSKKVENMKNNDTRCRGNSWYVPYESISNREKDRGSHPATYPTKLVENCIDFSGKKNGILIDPFMGSGTSAIAAINKNLNYIGFDIDEEYIKFANNRINEILQQYIFSDIYIVVRNKNKIKE